VFAIKIIIVIIIIIIIIQNNFFVEVDLPWSSDGYYLQELRIGAIAKPLELNELENGLKKSVISVQVR